jgi:hypothetical protein
MAQRRSLAKPESEVDEGVILEDDDEDSKGEPARRGRELARRLMRDLEDRLTKELGNSK